MSAKKGMEKYREIGLAAVVKEFTQLSKGAVTEQNKPVVEPIDADLLTTDNKKKALDMLNLIEEKRDGRIKGQTCANCSKQQQYLKYRDTLASPTVSIKGLITTV
eukprot:12971900-Ditylum_brightwellii.AAC.1